MAAVGFGAVAQRWVSLLHAGTTVRVAFNGWHTARFPVQSGVFQGSPLSPLLFFFLFFFVEESLHVHRCQSCQQPERQIKQTTGELRVHSTSYDKGSCFAMA